MNDIAKLEMTNEVDLSSGYIEIQKSKAVAQIQASMLIAQRFKRNKNEGYVEVMEACKRISLADRAIYSYPRGGKMVEGASIRLAEVLAQSFGNMHIDITIVNQTSDKTEAIATALDLQNNNISSQSFVVPHVRTTKKGTYKLTDERDIREMVQNIGSRVLRGCILRVVPPDWIEDAMAQCRKTQESSDVPIADQIKKMVLAFDEMGVKVEHLEKRLGHHMDATIPNEIVTLKGIYRSLRDGMSKREAYFDIGLENNNDAVAKIDELLNQKNVNAETGEIIPHEKE